MEKIIEGLQYEFNKGAEEIVNKSKTLSIRYAAFQNPPINYELVILSFITLDHPLYILFAKKFSLSTPFVKNKLYEHLLKTAEDRPTKENYEKEREYFKMVEKEAIGSKSVVITEEHLLLPIFKSKVKDNYVLKLLVDELCIKQEQLIDFIKQARYEDAMREIVKPTTLGTFFDKEPPRWEQESIQKVPYSADLDIFKYGINLNGLVETGKIRGIVSRDKEIQGLKEILAKKEQNNAILIGHPGVGKTAIVEGLAERIVAGNVPERLKGKIIVQLNISALVAGTTLRGQLEERIEKILNECKLNRDIILFLPDIHQVIGKESGDIGGLIQPALLKGDLRCIGTTTVSNYQKYIGKDSSFARAFQILRIDEPCIDTTRNIVETASKRFEEYHKVKIPSEAIDAAIQMSIRYIKDMYLPGKALSLLDHACSKGSLSPQAEKVITKTTIAEVISEKSDIPINQILFSKEDIFLNLEDKIKKRVIGQDLNIKRIVDVIQLTKYEMDLKPERPDGVFLICGPTGTGKTEFAKSLCEALLGSEKELLRFDMSEFMEKHNVSKLIGSPPGYEGSEEGGMLTNAVKANPYSVVLFDEVEKSHPDIFKLFLQIFDDGRLTDAKGMTVSFSYTTIIMTSNLGVGKLDILELKMIPVDKRIDYMKSRIEPEIKRFFPPEFLNRLDDILYFDFLSQETVRKITYSKIENVLKKFMEKGKNIKISPEIYNVIIENGYNIEYGARFLNRAIESLLLQPLTKYVLKNPLAKDIFVSMNKNTLQFSYK